MKPSFCHMLHRFSVTMEPHCAFKAVKHLFKNKGYYHHNDNDQSGFNVSYILANNWCFLASCMWLGGGTRKERTFVHHRRLASFSMLQKVCVPVYLHYSTIRLVLQYQAAGTAVSVIMYQNRYCNLTILVDFHLPYLRYRLIRFVNSHWPDFTSSK